MNEGKSWCVYRHTFQNGKVYIGITSQEPEDRWAGGTGYKYNDEMYNAILYYGWRNVSHEILYDGLDEATARKKEAELISEFGVDGRERTYNTSHTKYPGAPNLSWLDLKVNKETVNQHWLDFELLDDYWMEAYIQQMGAHPFGCRIKEDGVEITFYVPDGEYIVSKALFLRHPRKSVTFREVHKWLYTAPKAEVRTDENFKISKKQLAEMAQSMGA